MTHRAERWERGKRNSLSSTRSTLAPSEQQKSSARTSAQNSHGSAQHNWRKCREKLHDELRPRRPATEQKNPQLQKIGEKLAKKKSYFLPIFLPFVLVFACFLLLLSGAGKIELYPPGAVPVRKSNFAVTDKKRNKRNVSL